MPPRRNCHIALEAPEPQAGQPTYAELLQRVQELSERVNQQRTASSRLHRRPAVFNGTSDDIASREVETWLRVMEDYVAASGEDIESPDGIKIVASYLGIDPRRNYDSHVQANGEFHAYAEGFKTWLIQLYSPADPLHTYRDAFEKCRQKRDEPFDAFHSRFIKAHSLIDRPYEPKDLAYTFISHLISGVVGDVRRDIISYENLTTHDILAKLKRMYPNGIPLPQKSSGFQDRSLARRISDPSNDGAGSTEPSQKRHKPNRGHHSGNAKRANNPTNTPSNNFGDKTIPLTSAEKNWLTQNVKRGDRKSVV